MKEGKKLRVIGIVPSSEVKEIVYKFEKGSLPGVVHLLVRYPHKWYEQTGYYEEVRRKLRELRL